MARQACDPRARDPALVHARSLRDSAQRNHLVQRPSAGLHMKLHAISVALLLATAIACDSKPAEGEKKDDKSATDKKDDKKGGDAKTADSKPAKADEATLPTEVETIALDQGESKIPATIEVPKGSTTFNDDATKIRVDFGEGRERGKLFGVQVNKGNEFNLNLDETEKMMAESKYSKNAILEKTPTMLRWTMQNDDGPVGHYFKMIVDLKGEKWICENGNRGGFTEEQSKRQRDACATLKAK
jgi:hypothetical protein